MKTRILLLFILLWSTLSCLFSQHTGEFVDERDGRHYKWTQIGKQIWMAENLAYLPEVSPPILGVKSDEKNTGYCYVYDFKGISVKDAKRTNSYNTYGVLYNWEKAMEVCPDGWHLPSDEEYKILEKVVGMSDKDLNEAYYRQSGNIGNLLKSRTYWENNGSGIDKFAFSALPGGFRHNGDLSTSNPQGGFGFISVEAFFWTSTSTSKTTAYRRQLSSSSTGMVRFSHEKDQGYSVRCIKD